jgi:hypothetical protein
VAIDHPFCAEIRWMKESGVSTGFNDGTYRPTIAVTRQAMSAFMARLAGATLTACTEAPFSDVGIDHPFCAEIRWMKESGVSTGFNDGTYRPTIAVTRQAMSAFMARLAGADLTPCTEAPFSDVAIDHPFCPEIAWMKDSGVSTGFNDGTYRPTIAVTRQAMSAFMYRVRWLLPPPVPPPQSTITITESGFSPAHLVVSLGTNVIWHNQSGTTASVHSDNHPTHLRWPFLNLGFFEDGAYLSVVFLEVGEYTYHNEFDPSQTGTVEVVP